MKGKRNIQEVYPSPEPSIEEDYQPLSEKLKHLQKQAATTKAKEKGKQSIGEGSTSQPYLRRSNRLRGRGSKTQVKWPYFIDLGEEHSRSLHLAIVHLILNQVLKLVLHILMKALLSHS